MKKKDETVLAAIFCKNRKKILLIKRRDVPVWVLPGGKVEDNENEENAIIRETKEETGFDIKITKKIGEYTPLNKLTKFTHLYECKILSGKAKITNETKDIKFFDPNNLPKRIPPPFTEWIEDSYRNEKKLIKRKLTSITYRGFIKALFLHPILIIRFLLSRIGLNINT
jgi:8-oxo-dGTP pyrophosphatase MutT (NUDIX family)